MFFHIIYFIIDKIYKITVSRKIFYKYFMHIVWSFACYFQIISAGIFQSTKLCLIKAFEDYSNAFVVRMNALKNF